MLSNDRYKWFIEIYLLVKVLQDHNDRPSFLDLVKFGDIFDVYILTTLPMQGLDKKKINIVIPVYNEEKLILQLYRELKAEIAALPDYTFELIFVNDGSTDKTKELLVSVLQTETNVKLISFTRNFGHQEALRCGINYADGDAIISMDGDLQHPPKLIKELLIKWEEGYDIVNTLRRGHEGNGLFKRVSSNLFYKLFNTLSESTLHKASADFRLISKKVASKLQSEFEERNIFYRGLFSWMGYKHCFIEYELQRRVAGESKFTLSKMLTLADRGFSYFSLAPIKLGLYLGFVLFGLSFLYMFGSIIYGMIAGTLVPGWTSLLSLFLLISSVQFILIGILGIYIGHIFTEVKKRPTYIVDNIQSSSKPENEQ